MYCAQPPRLQGDPGTIIAALLDAQIEPAPLPPRYRPLIGMLVAPGTLDNGQPYLVGADMTCIEAVVTCGGEVRLIPVRWPHADEDACALLLDAVLQCDGLFFSGSVSQLDSRLDGQHDHGQTARAVSLLEWWRMLMTLIARETCTPLLGIGTGAASINIALRDTLRQERAGDHCCEAAPDRHSGQHILALDPDRLALCARGCNCSSPDDALSLENWWIAPGCMHDPALDTLAPDLVAWGWVEGQVRGFGYAGSAPWCLLAALSHLEAPSLAGLARFLFRSYVRACRAYAACLREVLGTTHMRDKLLRKLYAAPLAQPFLGGPPVSQPVSRER